MLSLGPQDLRCDLAPGWPCLLPLLCIMVIMHLQASGDILQVSCNVPSQAEPVQAGTPPQSDAETFCSAQRCYLRTRHSILNRMTPVAGLAMLVTTALIILLVTTPLGAM